MEKDVALQKAKMNYLDRVEGLASHPAFWSPFIQIGNTKATTLDTKSRGVAVYLGIGLLLLGLGYLARKQFM